MNERHRKINRRMTLRFAWFAAACLIFSLAMASAGAAKTNEPSPSLSAAELVRELRLGWNLGNSLDAMHKGRGFKLESETFWENPKPTKELIDAVSAAGFSAIRIPISYYNHLREDGTIDPAWLNRIEEVVGWALENDLYAIINIHHDTGMNPSLNWIFADTDEFEKSRVNFVSIWEQVAARFIETDQRLIFQSSGEWMNRERSWDNREDQRIVHALNQSFIDTVRNSGGKNADRFLMLSPFAASAEEEIIREMLHCPFSDPAGDKLLLSVHSYTLDPELISSGAQSLANIATEFGLPIVVDEIGFPKSMPRQQNLDAAKAYFSAAAEAGIVCFFWDDGYEYVILDRMTGEVADRELLELVFSIIGSPDESDRSPVQ